MNVLQPITIDFKLYEPQIKEKQTSVHYNGHYLKYVNNFNKLLIDNKNLKNIFCKVKEHSTKNFKKTLLLLIVELFDPNSNLVHNVAQIYNHELYWKTITNSQKSLSSLCYYKNNLFNSDELYNSFYNKFISLGTKHFASGWLWIIFNNNSLDVITTHDAIIPLNKKILGVIDLWEHSYYLDYEANRKGYLERVFLLIDWDYINKKITKILKN